MNHEPSYIIINLDGVRINIRLRAGATLHPLVPKMTGSWRLAECTSPIAVKLKKIKTKKCRELRGYPLQLQLTICNDSHRKKSVDVVTVGYRKTVRSLCTNGVDRCGPQVMARDQGVCHTARALPPL